MVFKGGCLCGALRYESIQDPVETGYCHCSLCRRSTGAPVAAFASFPTGGFSYTAGKPKVFQSSSWGQREFCGDCGTQICYRDTEKPKTVDVNSGTLDDLSEVAPQFHIYLESAVPWLAMDDRLPGYPRGHKD